MSRIEQTEAWLADHPNLVEVVSTSFTLLGWFTAGFFVGMVVGGSS